MTARGNHHEMHPFVPQCHWQKGKIGWKWSDEKWICAITIHAMISSAKIPHCNSHKHNPPGGLAIIPTPTATPVSSTLLGEIMWQTVFFKKKKTNVCSHNCHHPQCMSIMQREREIPVFPLSAERDTNAPRIPWGTQCSCHYNIAPQDELHSSQPSFPLNLFASHLKKI